MPFTQMRRFSLPRPDLPFARDDAGRFLPWTIACMVCLTALLLATALSVNHAMVDNQRAYSHTLTIQIAPDGDESSAQHTRKTLDLLDNTPGITHVTLLGRDELQQLIAPWLGADTPLDQLAMPTIIEATFDERLEDISALQTALHKAVPSADLQAPQQWVEKFSAFNRAVQMAAIALAVLLLANTLGMVTLACKTALKLHHNVVDLLHSIGAKDSYIARQFQANAFLLTLKGAGIGTAAACIVFALFTIISQGIQAPLLPPLEWSWWHVAVFAILPLLTAGTAFYVARKTVIAELEGMP